MENAEETGFDPYTPVTVTYDLLDALVDSDNCSFDHHGGCQAHGYLSLEQGETCPQKELKDVLELVRMQPGGDDHADQPHTTRPGRRTDRADREGHGADQAPRRGYGTSPVGHSLPPQPAVPDGPEVYWSAEYRRFYVLGPGPREARDDRGSLLWQEPEVRFMPSDVVRLAAPQPAVPDGEDEQREWDRDVLIAMDQEVPDGEDELAPNEKENS